MSQRLLIAFAAAFGLAGLAISPELAQAVESDAVNLTPAEVFAFARQAAEAGDLERAERAYRALIANEREELRTEARFRLALMLADQANRPRDAAILLREILDEKPDAARVRLELARIQVALGNYEAASRELRAAQAAGLPPQVEQLVRFYASALSARKPFGASLQIAIAPDSNINRATADDTLETIIGEFDLSDDARETSGIGLSLRGQGYYRHEIGSAADMLIRASALGQFFGRSEFNDYIVSLQIGPELKSGADAINLSGIVTHRWFGGDPYTAGYGVSANYRHPIDPRTRLTGDAAMICSDDLQNSLRDAFRLSASAGIDRAFTARFGGGARATAVRQIARDPGYSLISGGVDAYLFHEFGETTLVFEGGYSRLEADRRLFLYPERRADDRYSASISGTFRSFRIGRFAPLAKIEFEANQSTVGIYDYQRFGAEIGVTAAF